LPWCTRPWWTEYLARFPRYSWPAVFLAMLSCFIGGCDREPAGRGIPRDLQRAYRDLHHLHQYRVGKNSLVIGLETFCNRPALLHENGRKTILDLKGTGSLRHIWETHGPGTPPFILEFYVDGEPEPGIRGPFDELVDAAKICEQPFIARGGTTPEHDSYNFYLPVPFEKSLRIDLVANQQIDLVFLQLDYRLEDASMNGMRLVQERDHDAGKIKLAYFPAQTAENDNAGKRPLTRTGTWHFSGDRTVRVDGPAIIRRLALNAQREGVTLLIRFDGEASAAVNVDLADFFGPFRGVMLNNNQSYFPMPFRHSAEIEILGSSPTDEWHMEMDIERVPGFSPDWGYFHALHTRIDSSVAYQPFQVLSTKGTGNWLGMAVYDTHHDHGGGDFAIVDAGTNSPSFLHGINGEDYFSFAFFGQGENFPFSEAFDNDKGRMRIHFENPYPFTESIAVYWGVTGGLSPRSVAYWYQDTPADLSESASEAAGREWFVFGPVTVKQLAGNGNTPDVSDLDRLFSVLPDPGYLDAGLPAEAEHIMFGKTFKGTYHGWARQHTSGPHLNLMYVYGHVMPELGANQHMGYYARCMMARTEISSDRERQVILQISYDDPLQLFMNGREIYADADLSMGFVTRTVEADLSEGDNRLLVKMLDTPNNNTMWAGLSPRILEKHP
jgi:hypothetical protein